MMHVLVFLLRALWAIAYLPATSHGLARTLGIPMVKKMLLTSELIKAPELLASGYLYETANVEEITQAADALAHKLATLAPITQKASKLTIARLLQSNLPECTDLMRRDLQQPRL
jgi:enoyl-CoA hydratase/carnithine racemase